MERILHHRNIAPALCLTLLLAAVALCGWRVDDLQLRTREGEVLFSAPTRLGEHFTTFYIHSVELTPVEDEYTVIDGRIWSWQERVKSSNAGMPYVLPQEGSYFLRDGWMVYQGGRLNWKTFYLRVGNERFGKNRFELAPYGTTELYKILPGMQLGVTAERKPLWQSTTAGISRIFPAYH